ncbi:MAG: preprotein translocase subunit SecG [Flavobacteriaceae bacterium]
MGTYTVFIALIVVVCLLLILIIMVQNPKGGGLSSSFGGGSSQQMGGVQKTTDFLDRSTWVLGGILLALILLSNITLDRPQAANQDSRLLDPQEQTIPESIPEGIPESAPTEIPEIPEDQLPQ